MISAPLGIGFAGRMHYTAVEAAGCLVQALLELDAVRKKLTHRRKEDVLLRKF